MKLLVIDHHFEHDISALRDAAWRDDELVVLSAFYFRKRAARILPRAVTDGPLEAYGEEQYREQRDLAERACARALDEILMLEDFDAIVAPSDTFFYLRAVVRRAQELSVPFLIVQKETTIAPATMAEHSQRIGRTFPFIADRMFVCSERHKEFWRRTGADPALIDVLGQPRFDFYTGPTARKASDDTVPRVLYLSYMLSAYARPDEFDSDARTWEQLRAESEGALVAEACAGRIELAIKPHPQQRDVDQLGGRLERLAGSAYGRTVRLVPPGDDVRPWILASDAVVGFQTTALIEALAAGKRPVYTQWSDSVIAQRDRLIPFHEYPELFECVTSPAELVDATIAISSGSTASDAERDAFVTEHLGAIDGKASHRVLTAIAEYVDAHRPAPTASRDSVQAAKGRYRRSARRRARRRVAVSWTALRLGRALNVLPGLNREWCGLSGRLDLDRTRLEECSGRRRFGVPLVGEPSGLIEQIWPVLRRRVRWVSSDQPSASAARTV